MTPSRLVGTADGLTLEWPDGQRGTVTWKTLRDRCPCAVCRVARAETTPLPDLPVLSLAEARPLRATAMNPVGNYAYQVDFNDGHRSGIFPFDLLRQLSVPSVG
ncbi:MAG TPA: DUF971 domain-containing protein [Planctomycetaceae bacterium]|nr:DUF971 domain-containing protein [Planctomycetaceae bacterium]